MKIKTFLGIAITLLVLSVSKIQAQQVVLIEIEERNFFSEFSPVVIKTVYPDDNVELRSFNSKTDKDKMAPSLIIKKEIEKWIKLGFFMDKAYASVISYNAMTPLKITTIVLIKKED